MILPLFFLLAASHLTQSNATTAPPSAADATIAKQLTAELAWLLQPHPEKPLTDSISTTQAAPQKSPSRKIPKQQQQQQKLRRQGDYFPPPKSLKKLRKRSR